MDRALKERVVGATVLVVIAVLVVPVFLDGPSDEPEMVTETVNLPGQGEQSTKRQTIVLERDRDEPVPVATTAKRDEHPGGAATRPAIDESAAATSHARTDKPAEKPAAEVPSQKPVTHAPDNDQPAGGSKPAATAPAGTAAAAKSATGTSAANTSATGMWAVQLGSFSDQANAERLAADLRKQGYAAFLSRVQTNSQVLHRVRVGPQQDRASAEKIAARLAADGHKGQVVPHP